MPREITRRGHLKSANYKVRQPYEWQSAAAGNVKIED